jgi:hypothetical protein
MHEANKLPHSVVTVFLYSWSILPHLPGSLGCKLFTMSLRYSPSDMWLAWCAILLICMPTLLTNSYVTMQQSFVSHKMGLHFTGCLCCHFASTVGLNKMPSSTIDMQKLVYCWYIDCGGITLQMAFTLH